MEPRKEAKRSECQEDTGSAGIAAQNSAKEFRSGADKHSCRDRQDFLYRPTKIAMFGSAAETDQCQEQDIEK